MSRPKPQDDSGPGPDTSRIDDYKWFLGILTVICLAAFGVLWAYIWRVDDKANGTVTNLGKLEERINGLNEKIRDLKSEINEISHQKLIQVQPATPAAANPPIPQTVPNQANPKQQ